MKFLTIVLVLSCTFFSHAETKTVAEQTERVRIYGAKVRDILVKRILGDFSGLDYFEEKYRSLDLQIIERNTTQIVHEKVDILKKILKDREDLVKKIAEAAEKLRNVGEIGPLLGSNIKFYQASNESETDPDTSEAQSNKIFYRNAKCECEYQRPEGVEASQCIKPVNGYRRNDHFGAYPVSYENTSVHIPTEIYNEGPDVLKDLYLSDGIDEIMRSEICKESEYSNFSRWVYFTSRHGIMRFFPDRKWSNDCQMPDVYDSRISPWYLNTVSSPKDITVLVDRSGSVEGSTLNLLRRSVQDFLDTITTNDFINIILFNEEADFIKGQCRGLLQATPRNKQILRNWIESFETKDQAFYEKGFSLSLKTLDNAQQSEMHTAKCNPTVIFFTDGDSMYPSEAISTWNKNGDKRIFAFTVGKNFYGKEITKKIACENRGYFDSIPSFTATKANVHKYLVKLSEPLTMNKEKIVKWTLPYKDKLELGFVISASVPVKETDEEEKEKIAGVVGTDVLLDDLKKTVTELDMGQDYYPILMDNNGFVLIHPSLKEENHDDLITVDFMELEHKNLENIRKDMIDGNTASTAELKSKDLVLDKKYLLTSLYKYDYAPIEGTVLKFGLGIHSSKLKSLDSVSALQSHYPDLTWKKLIEEQKSDTTVLLYSSPCISRNVKSFNPCELAENSTGSGESEQNFQDGLPLEDFVADFCDANFPIYSDLLLHAVLSDDLSAEQWEKNASVTSGNGVLALYTALETPSFIRTKYLNFTEQTNGAIGKDDETVKMEIEKILANPRDSTYLRKTIHTHSSTPGWTMYSFVETPIIVPTPGPTTTATPDTGTTTSSEMTTFAAFSSATTEGLPAVKRIKAGYIIASRAVKVVSSDPVVAPVVTGVVLHPDTFWKNVFNLAYRCNDAANCTADDWDLLCNDMENTECLILDDGGFLLSSNQEKHFDMINKFLGLVDGEFMRILINQNVYDKNFVFDYQEICPKAEGDDSSAGFPRYFVPTIADMLSFGWWLSSCARMFFYSFFQNLFLGSWSLFDFGSSHIVVHPGSSLPTKRQKCIIKTPVLTYGQNSHGTHFGTFDCTETCTRSYTVFRIEDTNLLLAIADTAVICGGSCSIVAPFLNEDDDVTIEETCNNETRYRKPPDETCYDARDYDEALDSPCSSALMNLPFSMLLLFTMLHFAICQYIL